MSAKELVENCYAKNGNVAQPANSDFVGVRAGPVSSLPRDPFSSGICDCDSGDCCSPGRTI